MRLWLADLAGRSGPLTATVTWLMTLAMVGIVIVVPLGITGRLS